MMAEKAHEASAEPQRACETTLDISLSSSSPPEQGAKTKRKRLVKLSGKKPKATRKSKDKALKRLDRDVKRTVAARCARDRKVGKTKRVNNKLTNLVDAEAIESRRASPPSSDISDDLASFIVPDGEEESSLISSEDRIVYDDEEAERQDSANGRAIYRQSLFSQDSMRPAGFSSPQKANQNKFKLQYGDRALPVFSLHNSHHCEKTEPSGEVIIKDRPPKGTEQHAPRRRNLMPAKAKHDKKRKQNAQHTKPDASWDTTKTGPKGDPRSLATSASSKPPAWPLGLSVTQIRSGTANSADLGNAKTTRLVFTKAQSSTVRETAGRETVELSPENKEMPDVMHRKEVVEDDTVDVDVLLFSEDPEQSCTFDTRSPTRTSSNTKEPLEPTLSPGSGSFCDSLAPLATPERCSQHTRWSMRNPTRANTVLTTERPQAHDNQAKSEVASLAHKKDQKIVIIAIEELGRDLVPKILQDKYKVKSCGFPLATADYLISGGDASHSGLPVLRYKQMELLRGVNTIKTDIKQLEAEGYGRAALLLYFDIPVDGRFQHIIDSICVHSKIAIDVHIVGDEGEAAGAIHALCQAEVHQGRAFCQCTANPEFLNVEKNRKIVQEISGIKGISLALALRVLCISGGTDNLQQNSFSLLCAKGIPPGEAKAIVQYYQSL